MPTHLALTPAWQDIQHRLRTTVGDSTFDLWLAVVEPTSFDGAVLTLHSPAGTDTWIADRYRTAIERSVHDVLGVSTRVVFATLAGGAIATAPPPGVHAPASPPVAESTPPNPRHTFEQFVIGDSNRLAHAAALAVAEAPGQAYNPLFLYAAPGLGKTHLLNAIANYLSIFDPAVSVRYTTVEAFTNGFIAALGVRGLDRFKAAYRGVDVLLIDDVQFLASKARTEEEFFHTFNALYDCGRQLVLTCDRLPSQLTGIERRLRERFESGLVAHIGVPDWRTRMTILRKRATLDDVDVGDDVLKVIAERVPDNIRSLQGALIHVVAHHSLTGRRLGVGSTTEILDSIHPTPTSRTPGSRPVSVAQIQEFAAKQFGVSREQLTSADRSANVTWPRQLAIYLARELTGSPLQTIGEAFGGRSHATVLHACKRVSDRISVNNSDAADLKTLTEGLFPPHNDR